ncbi:MAG: hypothetical protein HW421_362 [Ignavibacteria bacterium]|nr:hypothetical protein [Ignavibacteria bacterium]
MKEKAIIIILFLFFFSNKVYTQNISARATIDTNNVLIGDQLLLKLELKAPRDIRVVWPVVPDSIGKIIFIAATPIDTSDTNGIRLYRQRFVITSFDSGSYSIPPFTFMYERKGLPDMYPANTDPIFIKFATVPVDTTKPFKDIKPPAEEPNTWLDYWEYIALALGLVIIGDAIYFYLFYKKRKKHDELGYDPRIPPHIAAMEALKKLDNEKLWQNNMIKEFHVRLTEILRLYIERQIQFPALEMVTDEIIDGLRKAMLPPDLMNLARKILELADLVKFAKHEPLPDENSSSMAAAYQFINKTIPLINGNETNPEEKQ